MEIDYSLHYSKYHDSTDAHYYETSFFLNRILSPILRTIDASAQILDVGCGTGLLVFALLQAGYTNVRGVDISPHQISDAQRRGLPCSVVSQSYLRDLAAAAPKSFDLILLMDVLEHLEVSEQLDFLQAARLLLRPGGRLVVSVPNANSSFAMRWRFIDWTHRTSFTEDSLEFVLRNAGYSSLIFHPYEFGGKAAFPYFHSVSFWVPLLRGCFRLFRRIEAIAELGRAGLRIQLSLNLLVEARTEHEII